MRKLTRITSMLASALVAVALTACGGSKSADNADGTRTELTPQQERHLKGLEMEINKLNKQLPMETGDGLTLTKMELTDGYMVSTCTYPADSDLEIDNSPESKAAILQTAGAATVKRIKDLNIGLKYIYQEEGTGKTQEIVITPEEM
ncbi:MAG: hypothetical protein JFT11_09955 [Muribaculaceae bacterium]|nr:hypothetical protein [Muribaculaceae bacterium]